MTEELWTELGFGPSIQLESWPAKVSRPRRKIFNPRRRSLRRRRPRSLPARRTRPALQPENSVLPRAGELPADQCRPCCKRCSTPRNFISANRRIPAPRPSRRVGELYLPGTGLIDPALEIERLKKDLVKVTKDLEQTRKKLGDANMLAKAPPAKVEEWRALEVTLTAKEKSSAKASPATDAGECPRPHPERIRMSASASKRHQGNN